MKPWPRWHPGGPALLWLEADAACCAVPPCACCLLCRGCDRGLLSGAAPPCVNSLAEGAALFARAPAQIPATAAKAAELLPQVDAKKAAFLAK